MRFRLWLGTVAAMVVFGTGAYLASAHTSSVHPFATGTQTISSGPGVYAQTTSEYAASWTWTQLSASYDYYWYLFTSGGTLTASGHKASGGNGGWSGVADVYYLKEYNNEASGSGHINVLQVNYCC